MRARSVPNSDLPIGTLWRWAGAFHPARKRPKSGHSEQRQTHGFLALDVDARPAHPATIVETTAAWTHDSSATRTQRAQAHRQQEPDTGPIAAQADRGPWPRLS
jgi:hypothetical protein